MPVAMLGEVGEQVVAVHGQSDQLRLLRPAEQRAALDRFAGADHEKLLRDLSRGVHRWRAAGRRPGRPAAQRPRAQPGGRPAPAGPRRDHPGRPAARRGRRAARRGAAAGARRGAADRPRRPRTPRWPAADEAADDAADATQPARRGPAHAGGAGRGRPGAGRPGRPARGGGHAWSRDVVGRAVGLSGAGSTPTRPGCRPIYERRAALRGADPQVRRRRRRRASPGPTRPAARLGELDTSDELLEELDRERQRLARRGRRSWPAGCPRPGAEAAGRFAEAGHRRSWPGWRCRTRGSRWRCCRRPAGAASRP